MFYPILKNENEILSLLRKKIPPTSKDLLCFFSSHLQAFITDPLFMNIALEDKIIHRGYAVFETTKIFNNKIYQLDQHIARFLKSINYIDLKPAISEKEIKDILIQTAKLGREIEPNNDLELRFFYTAGLGNFSVGVDERYPSFYAFALRVYHSVRPVDGTSEALVNVKEIQDNVVHSKNTNYLINSIVTKKAKQDGGYLGIMVDENGHMLESPISNVAFLLNDGTFSVPPFEKTLAGTTVIRCMQYINDVLIPNGVVKCISRDYVSVNEIDKVKEAMLVGGDHVIPILKLGEYKLSESPGEVVRMLQGYLNNDRKSEEVCDEIF
jgi:branched-subunit amino acid aminotransferase/4-amino-4-deoxychorismate lyase